MENILELQQNSLFQRYLEDFHLPPKQKIKHYSRGMTMKLAIAAALSHHPQLLILDVIRLIQNSLFNSVNLFFCYLQQ